VKQSSGFSLAQAVSAVLDATVPGELLTYGEVAALAGHPGGARAVGNVLARSQGLPWWRVVSSQGQLVPGHESSQAELLAAEGVDVQDGRCQLASRGVRHRGARRGSG
jgi:methylated-DNA-protein-cysteine methyltransferase-like protein